MIVLLGFFPFHTSFGKELDSGLHFDIHLQSAKVLSCILYFQTKAVSLRGMSLLSRVVLL